MGYSIANYGSMFNDKWRMDAYTAAIKKHINKDTVVLDLGAGTGIFTLLACKLGAKKVIAIEPDNSLDVAIKSVKRNGFAEMVEFYNLPSGEVVLDQKADLIISDLRGLLPLLGRNIETIVDARKRFLKRNGVFIPGTDKIYAAISNSPGLYGTIVNTWEKNRFDFNLDDGKNICLNNLYSDNYRSSKMITGKKLWQKIDYKKINGSGFSNTLDFKVLKNGRAHGISVWFDSELTSGVKLRNSPDVKGAEVYGRAFFPFQEPQRLEAGDRVRLKLSARIVSDDYIWSWNSKFFKKSTGTPFNEFNQSTFYAAPVTPDFFIKRSHDHKTALNGKAKIMYDVLKMFSKKRKLLDIAIAIHKKYPGEFRDLNEAIASVGDISYKYSK